MRPVYQSRTGRDGRCMSACVASILELPEAAVPDFLDGDQAKLVNQFTHKHGLHYRRVPLSSPPTGWHTVEGISPRGGMHAIIGRDGRQAFDPHRPDGTGNGIVEPMYYGEFMPLDKYRAGLHRALDAALDSADAHVGMLGVNADKAKALKAQLERQGYEYRFPVAPPEDLMVRHGFVKRDKPLSEGGKNDWKILNERKNGYHNVTNL
jgi:hypothetical protein